jgi:hypothetical protein
MEHLWVLYSSTTGSRSQWSLAIGTYEQRSTSSGVGSSSELIPARQSILSVPPARLPACRRPVVTYDFGKANSPRRRRPLSDAPNMSSRVRGPGIVEEESSK